MLESHVRPEKKPRTLPKDRAKVLLSKNKKLILIVLLSIFGCLIWQNSYRLSQSQKKSEQSLTESSLVKLRAISPSARLSQLTEIAQDSKKRDSEATMRDRHRALYLLASDLIQQQKGELALTYLQGLGKDYPLLRPQILLKIAQAYQQDKQEKAAQRTLKYLIKTYPASPVTANALSLLEENKAQNEARLIKEFPYHPITQKIARQRLKQDPQQFELLLLLAKYSRDSDLNQIRDRLVLKYPANLTPEDWEAIADGYWRDEEHRKAADAYIYASSTPRNLYRAARGFHRNGNIDTAKTAYQRLLSEYHDAREAGEALVYLASISSGDEAVVYLEKAIAKFPENAPNAYLSKAIVHERFDKNVAAE